MKISMFISIISVIIEVLCVFEIDQKILRNIKKNNSDRKEIKANNNIADKDE